MRRQRRRRQSSMHEYFGEERPGGAAQSLPPAKQQAIAAFNNRVHGQDTFVTSRLVKTTQLYSPAASPDRLKEWLKPQFNWCDVTAEMVITGRAPGAYSVRSEPFQAFKQEQENEEVNMEHLRKRLFHTALFFQTACLDRAGATSTAKQAQLAQQFFEVTPEAFYGVGKEEGYQHLMLLQRLAEPARKTQKGPAQTPKAKKMQAKLDAVWKMVKVYDMSLTEACREAKVSRPAAKKWLRRREQALSAAPRYDYTVANPYPRKLMFLSIVKEFIDKRDGYVFVKDIQHNLETAWGVHVNERTLNYWIKRNLRYTYKKASTVSPDVSKVEFVRH